MATKWTVFASGKDKQFECIKLHIAQAGKNGKMYKIDQCFWIEEDDTSVEVRNFFF